MPDYTFQSLSPYDLETLVRDLLQAELKVRLEQFSSGRDSGIDLRYAAGESGALIVQCKHFSGSSWSDLRRSLRAEVPKVNKLAPQRYMVATTVRLNPGRKDWIQQQFTPYCHGPSDIFGVDDLNNLLARHPEVERRHHKLWLTSVPVLESILHADVFAEQESDLESLRRRLCRFVSNPSVERALEILDKHHFCLITGVPGIGKTTLAEMLLIDHLDRGYNCFRIWGDIRQARKVWHREVPQLFYFDDFLGRTGLQRVPERNEDELLMHFIEDVAEAKSARLLLTSREYILNQARWVLEALKAANLDVARCVLSLEDYTQRIRATILYNHLYYSGLPRSHIEAFIRQGTYRDVVRHRNYSPRIVDAMTNVLNIRDLAPEQYPRAFVDNLSNPRRLWEVAYDGHLTVAAQNALLVMVTLPDEVMLDIAEQAFESFHRARVARYGQSGSPYDWQRALKELEGNFLVNELRYGELVVHFHNPSVRDFLEARINEHSRDASELVEFSTFPSQLVRLAEVLGRGGDRSWVPHLVTQFLTVFDRPAINAHAVTSGDSGTITWYTPRETPLRRFLTLNRIVGAGKVQGVEATLAEAVGLLERHLNEDLPDRRELSEFIGLVLKGQVAGVESGDKAMELAIERAFSDLNSFQMSTEDFDALLRLLDQHPDLIGSDEAEAVLESFREFCGAEVDRIMGDYDAETAISAFMDLEPVASRCGVHLAITADDLESLGYAEEEDYEPRLGGSGGTDGPIGDAELDDLFGSLLSA